MRAPELLAGNSSEVTIMPATVNLPAIERGDSTPFSFNFDDGTDPIDMRGKTIILTLKVAQVIKDSEASLIKSVTPDAGDTDAQNGIVTIVLEASETALLTPFFTYFYAVRIREPGGVEQVETTYLKGEIPVEDA